MKAGTVFAILVLAGYLGMEAYAFRKVSHRMEPAYIHDLLVKARVATDACNSANADLQVRFRKTYQRVTERYRVTLTDENPDSDKATIDQLITEKTAASVNAVEQQMAKLNCSDIEMQNHARRYEIYARKTR